MATDDLFYDLLDALKPFANEAASWDRDVSDRAVVYVSLSTTEPQSTRIVINDLRFAAKVYRRAKHKAEFEELMAEARKAAFPLTRTERFTGSYADSFAA